MSESPRSAYARARAEAQRQLKAMIARRAEIDRLTERARELILSSYEALANAEAILRSSPTGNIADYPAETHWKSSAASRAGASQRT